MYPIDFFWRAARQFPDEPALIHPTKSVTFRELALRVSDMAALLAKHAGPDRSPVCLGAANTIDHLIAILATLAANKIWVPLNPRNGDPELRRIVEFAEPSLVIVDAAMHDRLCGAHNSMFLLSDLGAARSANSGWSERFASAPALDSTQAIKFTGGTTGIPKGVMQPLRAWNTNIVTQMHEFGLCQSDRYLVAAPLTHGTSTYMLPILGSGGALVFPDEAGTAALLDAAEKNKVTIFFAPPTLIFSLIDEQRRRSRPLHHLRYLVYGGAPMRPEQILEAQDAFENVVCTSYGQTEAPQIITFLPPSEMVGDNLASVGRPTLLSEIGIFSKEGALLPDGEAGEIAVRGDLVMTGYLKAPDESRRTLVDGWLRTGDFGSIDERGFLYIKDRIRDVIITGGFNVYPSDVETVLSRHAAIGDCAIVGVPDRKWGEAVHAAIQVRPGFKIDPGELVSMVKRELGSVKAPKEIHLFEALPRSPVGKVLKAAIRDEIIRKRGVE